MKTCLRLKTIIEQITAKHSIDLTNSEAILQLEQPGDNWLCIETVGSNRISVAQYFAGQRPHSPEPDVLIWVDAHKRWIPIGIARTRGPWRTYVELSEDDSEIVTSNPQAQADLAAFCEGWAQTLVAQRWLTEGVPREPSNRRLIFSEPPLFSLGDIVATPGAIAALRASGQDAKEFLQRHAMGDWGTLPEEDQQENERAVRVGLRVFSAYLTHKGVKLWVITEHDRSVTTLLLPEDY